MRNFMQGRSTYIKLIGGLAAITLLLLLCIWGFGGDGTADSLFYICENEDQELLVFDQGGEDLFIVLRNSENIEAYALNLESGQLTTEELSPELGRASVAGSSLGIYYRDDYTSSLSLWNSSILMSEAIENQFLYFIAAAEDRKCTFTSDGALFAVSEAGKLEQWTPVSKKPKDVGLKEPDFLITTPGEWVYAYAQETLYRWRGRDSDQEESWKCHAAPAWMVGEEAFVDTSGALFLIRDGELFEAPEALSQLDTSRCYIKDNEVYAADPTGEIYRYNLDGTATGRQPWAGEVLRLAAEGALVQKDGRLWFAPYQFQDIEEQPEETPPPTIEPSEEPEASESPLPTEEATPTPEATPSAVPSPELSPEPSETSSPTPEPGEDTETPVPTPGGSPLYETTTWDGVEYILLDEEMTVKKLQKMMEPQWVYIYDLEGNLASEGILKTGMTLTSKISPENKVIVILGDCNGNGHVNSKDIELASMCILGGDYLRSDAAFLAVDLDRDGSLTLRDLILLSEKISE